MYFIYRTRNVQNNNYSWSGYAAIASMGSAHFMAARSTQRMGNRWSAVARWLLPKWQLFINSLSCDVCVRVCSVFNQFLLNHYVNGSSGREYAITWQLMGTLVRCWDLILTHSWPTGQHETNTYHSGFAVTNNVKWHLLRFGWNIIAKWLFVVLKTGWWHQWGTSPAHTLRIVWPDSEKKKEKIKQQLVRFGLWAQCANRCVYTAIELIYIMFAFVMCLRLHFATKRQQKTVSPDRQSTDECAQ